MRTLAILAAGALTATSACAWTQTLDNGVVALERSRSSIDANTAAAARGAGQVAELRTTIEGLRELQSSVAHMATLLGPLAGVDQQLEAVAGLGPALARVGELNAALDRVAGLAPALVDLGHLDRIFGDSAGLGGLRAELADLRQTLTGLTQVRDAMRDLVTLRSDLRSVASSMTRLGSLVEPMDRLSSASRWLQPSTLLMLSLLWGALTMMATMAGVFLGHRIRRLGLRPR